MSERDPGFLSRWSRRKALSRAGDQPASAVALARPDPGSVEARAPGPAVAGPTPSAGPAASHAPVPKDPPKSAQPATMGQAAAASGEAPPEPLADDAGTLAHPDTLTPDSDFRPYLRANVDPSIRNAAMRKLFSDPHFNVMDGLDIYIDDYGKPDPIPETMLRAMHQSQVLGLFAPLDEAAPAGGLTRLREGSGAQTLQAPDSPGEAAAPPDPEPPGPAETTDATTASAAGGSPPGSAPDSPDIAVRHVTLGDDGTDLSGGTSRG